ncbi:MAG: phosphotransferase [Gammaproteobacteria bacterium]
MVLCPYPDAKERDMMQAHLVELFEGQSMSEFQDWLTQQLHIPIRHIAPLAPDAGFRRYYRLQLADNTSLIAVDSPPATENNAAFVAIAQLFAQKNLCVPTILAADIDKGYLLLSDLGDRHYHEHLTLATADALYGSAIEKLLHIQTIAQTQDWQFPLFNHALLMEELTRFQEWYLVKHLQLDLTAEDHRVLETAFTLLVNSALEQPQVCVHRDYHSRNLMVMPQNEVGILDFQDAVWGPITYDLVSLLRDRYFDWPAEKISQWVLSYYAQAQAAQLLPLSVSQAQFLQWFDWMGLQRHLKMLYIFARKWHRDHNPNYLAIMPRSLAFVKAAVQGYKEFEPLDRLLIQYRVYEEG